MLVPARDAGCTPARIERQQWGEAREVIRSRIMRGFRQWLRRVIQHRVVLPVKNTAAGAAVRSPILKIQGCRQCPPPFSPRQRSGRQAAVAGQE